MKRFPMTAIAISTLVFSTVTVACGSNADQGASSGNVTGSSSSSGGSSSGGSSSGGSSSGGSSSGGSSSGGSSGAVADGGGDGGGAVVDGGGVDAAPLGSKVFPMAKNGAPVTLRKKGIYRGASAIYFVANPPGYPANTICKEYLYEEECTATLRIDPGVALHFDNLSCTTVTNDRTNGRVIDCGTYCGNTIGAAASGPFCGDPPVGICPGLVVQGDHPAAGCTKPSGVPAHPQRWDYLNGGYRPSFLSEKSVDFFANRAFASDGPVVGGAQTTSGAQATWELLY
jgi:hypothetical protein